MFIDTGRPSCVPMPSGCSCGKYFEIWNDVFMGYKKNSDGTYEEMSRKCVDTGMGIERTIAILQGKKSVYETEVFTPIIAGIERLSLRNTMVMMRRMMFPSAFWPIMCVPACSFLAISGV
jgi:alanyl-tRNA synthetase